MAKINIKIGDLELKAELNESKIAKKILNILPISSKANTWGDEIYFKIPLKEKIEKPVKEVKKYDIGYWPTGACFCIFFGPTPVSYGDKIIPASDVEIIGFLITQDYEGLKKVKDGEKIEIEKGGI